MPSGNELFGRRYRLIVGNLDVSNLDVTFKIEKTSRQEPNKASIGVYNLPESDRHDLEESRSIRVRLDAGYVDRISTIFLGTLRRAQTQIDQPDALTVIEGEDGGRSYIDARISRSYPPGTNVDRVLRDCAEALGVGLGNATSALSGATLGAAWGVFEEGTTLHGPVRRELTRLLRSAGFRWSVQDGNLRIVRRGQALQSSAVVLSPQTGLIGYPSKDPQGVVSARCLMIPDVYPNRIVRFRDVRPAGDYRVIKTTYIGNTFGKDWYVDLEARAVEQ